MGCFIGVSNTIEGTGQSIYDYSSDYGSEGKLKAVMQLTGLSYLQSGPSLHELMHNWGNFGFETHSVDQPGENITSYPYWGHWGFTGGSTKGQLGGFEQSTLVELEDSSYSVAPFGPFANGGNGVPYNELELYLMGMAPLSSVIPLISLVILLSGLLLKQLMNLRQIQELPMTMLPLKIYWEQEYPILLSLKKNLNFW